VQRPLSGNGPKTSSCATRADAHQRYIEFNPAFERIFGIPVADAKGRTSSQVLDAGLI
jgi:PAS domain-containing protein